MQNILLYDTTTMYESYLPINNLGILSSSLMDSFFTEGLLLTVELIPEGHYIGPKQCTLKSQVWLPMSYMYMYSVQS